MPTPIGKILAEQRGVLLAQIPLEQLAARGLGQRSTKLAADDDDGPPSSIIARSPL
jgi:hypothetical protein